MGFMKAYWMHTDSGAETSILVLSSNSIEGFSEHGVFIGSDGGGNSNVSIDGNQISVFGAGAQGVRLDAQQNVIVSANAFRLGGEDECGVSVGGCHLFRIGPNVMQANAGHSGYAVDVSASASSGYVDKQTTAGLGNQVRNQSATTSLAA